MPDLLGGGPVPPIDQLNLDYRATAQRPAGDFGGRRLAIDALHSVPRSLLADIGTAGNNHLYHEVTAAAAPFSKALSSGKSTTTRNPPSGESASPIAPP